MKAKLYIGRDFWKMIEVDGSGASPPATIKVEVFPSLELYVPYHTDPLLPEAYTEYRLVFALDERFSYNKDHWHYFLDPVATWGK